MTKIVPLISSGTAGPLGVLHLPRLWQKASLEAAGKLHPDYPGCGKGYDQMVIDGLALNRDAVLAFLRAHKPTYPQFEEWIKKQPGVKLDQASIEKLNAAIRGYNHTDDIRKSILSATGLPDNATAPKDAVNLNNLDDWFTFWSEELK
jgi:hypothetical protein